MQRNMIGRSDLAQSASLSPITQRYLVCLNVQCYRDAGGGHYFDRLWQRDLLEHVRYLTDLTLFPPAMPGRRRRTRINAKHRLDASDSLMFQLPSLS